MTIMFSGTFLLMFGVATIIFQMWDQHQTGKPTTVTLSAAAVPSAKIAMPSEQQMSASAEGFKATTHYVGVELIMVGAVLQIVGFVGFRISKPSAG